MKFIVLLTGLFFWTRTTFSQISYTWNGSVSTAWAVPANWSPIGVPTVIDNVTIVTGSNNCILSISTSVNNLIVTSGILNLNGFTLTATGPTATFTAGTVQNGVLTVSGATTSSFGAGPFTMNCSLNITSATITIKNATFQNTTNITKTGGTNDASSGNNIFNGITNITNSGSGYFMMGNGNADHFNGAATFNNSGSGNMYLAYNSANNVFGAVATFNNIPTSNNGIYISPYSAGTMFNDNIAVTSTNGQGVQFCSGNTSSTVILAATKTITIGSGGFSAGTLLLKQFTQVGSTPINLTLTGSTTVMQVGPASSIGGAFTVTSPRILVNGGLYAGPVSLTKTGATGEWSAGGNTFNSTLTINQMGSGYFGFANGTADIYNGDVYANNNSTERIIFGNNSMSNQFNGNIILTQTGSSLGIAFGWNATTSETLAAGKTISIGGAGFSAGYLQIEEFTQLGNAPVNLPLTGTGTLTYGPSAVFGGNVTSSSPSLYLNGCTFSGSANITKTGSTGDYSRGGNVFNGVSTITNSGSSFLLMGNISPDTWNNDVTFTNNGSERLLPCWATTGNQFNGNIYVNTSGSAQGIQFCGGNTTASATVASGKTIQSGSTGLTAGYLILKQFTQAGNTAVNLTLSSTATYLQFGPLSSIGGDVLSSSPGLFFNGCTFGGMLNSTKTGATNDASIGNNVFNGASTLINAGAGYLMLGNGNQDQFNSTAVFNNTGSSNIYVAYNSANNIFGGITTFNNTPAANTAIYVSWNSAGTVFNNNIIVTSTSGQGVQFCGGNSGATATLSAGNIIGVGPAGFSSGTLLLKQFTQSGATAQNITFTGSGNLTFGPSSAFGGNVTTVTPTIFFNGCNFSGTVTSGKNGSTNDASIGNNIFNGAFIITNTGSGYFLMGNGNPDTWQSTAVFNNYSTGQHMYTAYNSTGNIFNGDVFFNNQPTANNLWIYSNVFGTNTQFNGNISVVNVNGGGVYFGSNTGTSTLASGKTITAGAGGFNYGGLILRNFTQTGAATPQNINLAGTSYVQYGPAASFDGAVTSASPGLLFNGSVFNGMVNCVKTGTTNDQSQGNNTFNGQSTFTNNGTGYLLMTNTTGDAYNGNTTFVQNNTGAVYPNYNGSSNYAANLIVTSPAAIPMIFGSNTGTAVFSGSGAQSISVTAGTPAPVFTRLNIANTGSGVTLSNTSVNVSKNLTLSTGLLNTNTTYLLTMLNGSVTAAGTALSASYVNGPMRYQKSTAGSSVLNFPIGTSPDCRPVSLTINHANGNLYTYQAQLFDASAAALNYTLPATADVVSGVHYYTISRVNALSVNQPTLDLSGNQTIQIFFGSNDVVTNGTTLTIVKNVYTTPTKWIDIGGTGGPGYSGGSNLSGSITSTSSPSAFNSFSTFALADEFGGGNVLPILLLYFRATPDNGQVKLSWATSTESNNDYFTIERSQDALHFESVQQVNTEAPDGNSSVELYYSGLDVNPYPGQSYYRLKQTDRNGNITYSNVDPVNLAKTAQVSVYPNPASGHIYIHGLDAGQKMLHIEWYDLSGKNLLQQTVTVQDGTASLNVPFENGIYILRFITADGKSSSQNILIRK